MAAYDTEPYWRSEQAFKDAVQLATEAAAQSIERSRPVWALFVAFLVGVVVACTIAIPITIVINNQVHSSESHNAEHNCTLITKVASALEENFNEGIKSKDEFLKNSVGRLGLTPGQFEKLIKKSETSQKRQLSSIKAVAATDCEIVK